MSRTLYLYLSASAATAATTWWGKITGPPSAKWQNFVTMLFFSTKIPTTKHEIMLHAMSLKGGLRTSTNCVHVSWQLGTNWISTLLIRQSDSGARVFVHVLKRKAGTLNTNWASSLGCFVAYNSIVYQSFLLRFIHSVLDKWATQYVKIFQLHLNNVATLPCKNSSG